MTDLSGTIGISGDNSGTVNEESQDTSTTSENAPALIDMTEMGDQLVEMKIDGETTQVPLKEALEHGMRQKAWTQKTQDLAEDKRLADAVRRDPKSFVRSMAAQLEMTVGEQGPDPEDELLSAEERKVKELEAQVVGLQQTVAANTHEQQIEKELAALEGEYGEFDRDALLSHALNTNTHNLEAAYLHMQKDSLIELKRAQAAAEASKQQVIEDKRSANVVSSGTGSAQGTLDGSVESPSDLRDAFALARQGKQVSEQMSLPSWLKR